MSKEEKLFSVCQKFMENQKVTCSECIYQSDRVIENAYDLIYDIADIVGYYKDEDENE